MIYDYPLSLFGRDKIIIENADFTGIERLANALGGEIKSVFEKTENDDMSLGYCDSIKEISIGDKKFTKFSGCKKSESCTIILRGSS